MDKKKGEAKEQMSAEAPNPESKEADKTKKKPQVRK